MLVSPRGEWIRHYSNAEHLQTDSRNSTVHHVGLRRYAPCTEFGGYN